MVGQPTLPRASDSVPAHKPLTAANNGFVCSALFLSPLLSAQERARASLLDLVTQLASMEHSFHHILLLEIKSLTDSFPSILGTQSRDIYRMSNSFSAIAKLLLRQLHTDSAAAAPRYCRCDQASALPRAL